MIVRIALLLASLPLFVHGAEGLYHALRSRTQAVVTCEQFSAARPGSGWVKIIGCQLDYVRAGYRESGGRVTELFIPIRPAASSPAQPAPIVISTSDPAIVELASELVVRRPTDMDDGAFLVAMLRVVAAMRATREVEGLTRSRLEMLRTRTALAKAIKAPLTDDFAVLDLRERPRFLIPAIEAVVGAQGLLVFLFLSVKARRRGGLKVDAGRDGESPGIESATPAPLAPGEFRRLMLVNLPPNAPSSELERAPALGTQAAVRGGLAQVLPGIVFDDDGRGHFSRPDHAIRLDLGTSPQVWTATVDVTGSDAAGALRRLIMQTGWRAYAPRLGRFITADDLRSSA